MILKSSLILLFASLSVGSSSIQSNATEPETELIDTNGHSLKNKTKSGRNFKKSSKNVITIKKCQLQSKGKVQKVKKTVRKNCERKIEEMKKEHDDYVFEMGRRRGKAAAEKEKNEEKIRTKYKGWIKKLKTTHKKLMKEEISLR